MKIVTFSNLFFVFLQALILFSIQVECKKPSKFNRQIQQQQPQQNSSSSDSSDSSDLQPMKYGEDTSGKYFASVWDSKKGGTYSAKGDQLGKYSVSWNEINDIVIGKGWKTGSTTRVINFDGNFSVEGNGAYLTVYGWSGGQCVEYYIVESWGEYKPCNGSPAINKGNYESDEGSYTACVIENLSGCIDGSSGNHVQFYSIRDSKRTSGKITFSNHVQGWEKFEMKLGSLSYPQIMAIEAYGDSSGSATISIDGSSP